MSTSARNAEAIFQAARSISRAERRLGFLDGACGDDAELRAAVDARLAAEAESVACPAGAEPGMEATLPQSALPVVEAHAELLAGAAERAGEVLGRYKLLELIGEGGFGTVWMAEQREPVARKVALKIIKPGMDTRQVIARFEAERQALALMDHPHIAKVFDAGATATGRPYFVMELCCGDSITEYCDRNHLSIHERLALFAEVCHAVQHAHQKGLIHRDLKPGNILVSTQDGRPRAKVIDFGIAKATVGRLTDRTLFTEHRQLIGTPQYMSPEQAEGSLDIDTRSDVYSLGVLLYELLTSVTPFDAKTLRGAAYDEMQRIIREVDPPHPSTRLLANTDTLARVAALRRTEPARLGSLVRGELDWIVMKALEKDRQRRYATANSLAVDVQRFLAGDAVLAAPPGRIYRVRKFVRRHRGAVTAAGLVALMLVLGIAGTTAGMIHARREEARADAETDRAKLAAEAESKARRRAETIGEFVTTALKSGDAHHAGGAQDMTILAAMDNALLDIAGGRFKDDPETEAALKATIAIILKNNGRVVEAESLCAEALEVRRRIHAGDHPELVRAINNLGDFRRTLGRLPQAEALFVESLAMARRLHPGDHLDVAVGLNNLASVYSMQGRPADAEPRFVEALEMFRRLFEGDHPHIAAGLSNLAFARRDLGRLSEAEPLVVQSLEMYERLFQGDHPAVAKALRDLAGMLRDLKRLAEAEPLLVRSLDMLQRLYTGDHPEVAACLNELGLVRGKLGRLDEAAPLLTRSLEMSERLLPADHPDLLGRMANIAGLYWASGHLDKSIPLFERVLAAREAKLGRNHPSTLLNVANLGVNYKDAGRLEEALPLLEEAYVASRRIPSLGWVSAPLLEVLAAGANPGEPQSVARAVARVREIIAESRAAMTADTSDAAGRLTQFASPLLTLKLFDDAEPLLREALALREKAMPDEWRTFNTKSMLGSALLGLKRFEEAEPLLLSGYQGMKEREAAIPVPSRTRIEQAGQRLLELYEATGNEAQLQAWKARLKAAG